MRKILVFTSFFVLFFFFSLFVSATKYVFAAPMYNADGTIRYNDTSTYGNSASTAYYGGYGSPYNSQGSNSYTYSYGNNGSYYSPGSATYSYYGSSGYPYNQGNSYYYGNNGSTYNHGGSYSYGNNNGQTMCTMEAMVCPNGSTVGRTGPNCAFSACPSVPYNTGSTYYSSYGSNPTFYTSGNMPYYGGSNGNYNYGSQYNQGYYLNNSIPWGTTRW